MMIDEAAQLIVRIAERITNPAYLLDERVDLATKWAQSAYLVSHKWNTTPWEVVRIFEEREPNAPMLEPTEMRDDEERILWDYVHECNQFEHIEGE